MYKLMYTYSHPLVLRHREYPHHLTINKFVILYEHVSVIRRRLLISINHDICRRLAGANKQPKINLLHKIKGKI